MTRGHTCVNDYWGTVNEIRSGFSDGLVGDFRVWGAAGTVDGEPTLAEAVMPN
jgi:hypothetical protein